MSIALITGVAAPSGIGRALAHAFLDAGYYVGAIDSIEAPDLQEDFRKADGKFSFVLADISDESSITSACRQILSQLNGTQINALINNAGISNPYTPTSTFSERSQHWRRVIDVNLTGAYLMSEVLSPYFVTGSSIIHISSTRARQSEPNCEAYAASKAGLLGLTHAQAVSLGSRGIRVNCILPGWINTGGYAVSSADESWHLSGRVGVPSDVSSLCLFLCDGHKSGFITGQQFVVDGGVSVKMVYPEDK
jgi:NAD(P)-dependent dehydrogenase (short-subunit alcohol dehydrogenase family)